MNAVFRRLMSVVSPAPREPEPINQVRAPAAIPQTRHLRPQRPAVTYTQLRNDYEPNIQPVVAACLINNNVNFSGKMFKFLKNTYVYKTFAWLLNVPIVGPIVGGLGVPLMGWVAPYASNFYRFLCKHIVVALGMIIPTSVMGIWWVATFLPHVAATATIGIAIPCAIDLLCHGIVFLKESSHSLYDWHRKVQSTSQGHAISFFIKIFELPREQDLVKMDTLKKTAKEYRFLDEKHVPELFESIFANQGMKNLKLIQVLRTVGLLSLFVKDPTKENCFTDKPCKKNNFNLYLRHGSKLLEKKHASAAVPYFKLAGESGKSKLKESAEIAGDFVALDALITKAGNHASLDLKYSFGIAVLNSRKYAARNPELRTRVFGLIRTGERPLSLDLLLCCEKDQDLRTSSRDRLITNTGYLNNHEVQYNLGRSYMEERNYRESVIKFRRALELNPGNLDYRYNYAESLRLSRTNNDEANTIIAAYQPILRAEETRHFGAFQGLGILKYNCARYGEAINDLNNAFSKGAPFRVLSPLIGPYINCLRALRHNIRTQEILQTYVPRRTNHH